MDCTRLSVCPSCAGTQLSNEKLDRQPKLDGNAARLKSN